MNQQPAHPHPKTIRGSVTWIAITLGSLALLVVVELALVTNWMHEATERMANEAEGVRAAERVDIALRAYNREHYLLARNPEPSHAHALQKSAADLKGYIKDAAAHVGTSEEAVLLERIEKSVHQYLQDAKAVKDPAAFESYLAGIRAIDTISEDLERLINVNIDQVNAARTDSMHLDRMANFSAAGLALLLLVSISFLLFWIRRSLYRPFAAVLTAMARYGTGDAQTRASLDGPEELRRIAQQFNDMADNLAGQREIRLQVLAAVAHDLRNPLAALRLATSVLERRGRDVSPAEMQQQLLMARRQIDRLDRMIGDFMDVSLIESGQFKLQLEPRDLRELAQNVVQLFQPTTTIHTFQLSLPDRPLPTDCDPTRIEQILNNLVSNAIKYSPRGGAIGIACTQSDGMAIVSVRDEGLGISTEDRRRLFTPFTRVGSSKDSIPGIGLGLSVTRRLVEAHGGRIELESTVGVGSTFNVILPLKAETPIPVNTPKAVSPNV